MKSLASDNYSGVHAEVMDALSRANNGHAPAYGADPITKAAEDRFRAAFGADTEVFFVYNGTGANVTSLSAVTRSFHAVFCSELAHSNVDESTAPEKFTGCKLIGLPTQDGKIYPSQVEDHIQRIGDPHHPQAGVITISQATEYGTVYREAEIRALASVAAKHGLHLHMDGARISNASVTLKQDFAAFTSQAGVDILSFGGTKNGLMFGEAVLIFKPALATYFKYLRKQAMQLHSKMRFIAAQYDAFLQNDLWKRNATHSNAMAGKLEAALRKIKGVTITQKVEANSVFALLPRAVITPLQEEIFFYVWNEKTCEVRLMCSFDTTDDDIGAFITKLRSLLS